MLDKDLAIVKMKERGFVVYVNGGATQLQFIRTGLISPWLKPGGYKAELIDVVEKNIIKHIFRKRGV